MPSLLLPRTPRPSSPNAARRALVGAVVAAALAASAAAPVSAQPSPSDVALAEALFREGKALFEQGKFGEACPKLAESQRIDPAGGTLLTLAICYEAAGKTASAWGVYGEALAVAHKDGRADRIKRAKESIAALEKRLSFLTVKVAPDAASIEGIELNRDGTRLGRAAVGVAVPIDPGKHQIAAKAPGYMPITIEVEVGPDGDRKTIEIPALEKEAPAPPPTTTVAAPPPPPPSATTVVAPSPPPPDEASGHGRGQRIAGVVLGTAGLASLVVGGVFGARAKSQHDDAVARCPSSPCPDLDGVELNEAAKTSALVTDITVGAGLALVGAGIVVWLTAPREEPSRSPTTTGSLRLTHVAPALGNGSGAISVGGTF